jgi:hypothetical protein
MINCYHGANIKLKYHIQAVEDAKSWQQLEEDEYNIDQESGRSPYYFQRLTPEVVLFLT